jgi:hypothetical protein
LNLTGNDPRFNPHPQASPIGTGAGHNVEATASGKLLRGSSIREEAQFRGAVILTID